MKRILMIITSHDKMVNTELKTGVWLGEFTDPYYELSDAGYEIVLASPQGGHPPVDPLSKLSKNITASNKRYMNDIITQHAFHSTIPLEKIETGDYDAVFYPGGHGPLWDLANDELNAKIVLDFYNSERPIAAVCHGPAAFIKAAELQPEILLGKNITAFTNTEEALVVRHNNIPYYLQTKLKELGAIMHFSAVPFLPHIEIDGLLITGQNPLSAGPAAKALINILEPQKVMES
jgi:putative intracellular protease/amidase